MAIKALFAFQAKQTEPNLARYRAAIELADPIPVRARETLQEIGARVHVMDSFGKKHFRQFTDPDGRRTSELPGMYNARSRLAFVPLVQKVHGFQTWIDCYDFMDAETLKKKGQAVPAYMQKYPGIQTRRYRSRVISHEFGHSIEAFHKLRYDGRYFKDYEADQIRIVASGLKRELIAEGISEDALNYVMTKAHGGLWKEEWRGMAEALANNFVSIATPGLAHVPMERLFPRLFNRYYDEWAPCIQ